MLIYLYIISLKSFKNIWSWRVDYIYKYMCGQAEILIKFKTVIILTIPILHSHTLSTPYWYTPLPPTLSLPLLLYLCLPECRCLHMCLYAYEKCLCKFYSSYFLNFGDVYLNEHQILGAYGSVYVSCWRKELFWILFR